MVVAVIIITSFYGQAEGVITGEKHSGAGVIKLRMENRTVCQICHHLIPVGKL